MTVYLTVFILYPEDGNDTFLRNFRNHPRHVRRMVAFPEDHKLWPLPSSRYLNVRGQCYQRKWLAPCGVLDSITERRREWIPVASSIKLQVQTQILQRKFTLTSVSYYFRCIFVIFTRPTLKNILTNVVRFNEVCGVYLCSFCVRAVYEEICEFRFERYHHESKLLLV